MKNKLLEITASMPMRHSNNQIQQYYAGKLSDNKDLYISRYCENAPDLYFHNMPFNYLEVVLCGGYNEESVGKNSESDWRVYLPQIATSEESIIDAIQMLQMGVNILSSFFLRNFEKPKKITVFDFHRIAAAEPETWTACIVDADRLPFWHFVERDGTLNAVESSPRDWYKDCGIRGES